MSKHNIFEGKESKTLEYKRDMSSLQPILKTLVAFANTAGGTLVIGRSDDGKFLGLPDIYKAEERLANAISDGIKPPLFPDIEIATYKKCDLLIVQVSHWKAPFYLAKEGPKKGVYVRLGSTTRLAPPTLLDELERYRIGKAYDQEPLEELDKEAIDFDKVHKFFPNISQNEVDKKLQSLGVLTPFMKRLVPTIGGLILFGKEIPKSRIMPDARVSCACFEGIDKSQFLDRLELEDTLEAPDSVMHFIRKNIRLRGEITGLRRKDIPDYPLVAVREAVINAIAHSDYAVLGSHVQIAIYTDRLEVQSPGMFPIGYTLDDFVSGISRSRNRVLSRIFRELNFMEEWGSGYKRIIGACKKGGYPMPIWEEVGQSLKVIFYPYKGSQTNSSPKTQIENLSEEELSILSIFEGESALAFSDIHSRIPLAKRTLRYKLGILRDKGLLITEGTGRSFKWRKHPA